MRRDVGPAAPPSVQVVLAGRPAGLVWENEAGGLTVEVTGSEERCFVKCVPTASGIDLGDEVDRLGRVGSSWPVPRVLDRGSAAYGVDPDPVRTAYYRLLWDLDP